MELPVAVLSKNEDKNEWNWIFIVIKNLIHRIGPIMQNSSFQWTEINENSCVHVWHKTFKMKMLNFSKQSPTTSSKPSNESEDDFNGLSSTVFGCFRINAQTVFYRRVYLLQMICFPFIPILALFVQNLSLFLHQIQSFDQATLVNKEVKKVSNENKSIINVLWFFLSIDSLYNS